MKLDEGVRSILVIIAFGAIGAFIIAACAGCSSPGQSAQTKSYLSLTDKIETLNGNVKQVQTTINQQTQNFQLDAQRAGVEVKRNKGLMRMGVAGFVAMLGLVILALCTGEFAAGKTKAMLIIVAICMLGAPALLLVWPF